jgi:predicted ATPase
MHIAGYHIQEQIYESENSLVYRGRREAGDLPVILKVLKQAYPSPEKTAWFRREYELLYRLHLEGVISAYSLITDQHRSVMVLEDFGGDSLELHLKRSLRRFTLSEFLPLAVRIATILSSVHQQRIIHKDVNPSNIVWNSQTGQVKLIDFGISTILTRENPILRNPRMGEGTLAYLSPEQTGRMNRTLDYRTDFYSLGVTFYELLTGQLPFPTIDALALMHAHLAKQPFPPHELVPDISSTLSMLVMKLMAKNAEDRYQSAYGLQADLEECWRRWRTAGGIDSFSLGQDDVTDRFHIPQKLYGRTGEIGALLNAFTNVSLGSSALVLVSGYAGAGKSALVQEVYKPITQRRGYFITGKCEQLHKNIPYAPLVQAFRGLIRQLLTEHDAQIALWQERLVAALGRNGQAIIDVVPEVALILGPQPSLPVLPPAEAQNRLNLVFLNFIRVFAKAEHPLVLFFDDLQWADSASLQIIRLLLTTPDNGSLLIIGAYRDNEVRETHPLLSIRDECQKAGSAVTHVVLRRLGLPSLYQWVADALSCSLDNGKPLAELVFAKTNGNPFFVKEFLRSLYAEELLTFDLSRKAWQWDVREIQQQNITDNVVEFLSLKLQKLQPQTQHVVKLAACIGNQFDLQILALLYKRSAAETAVDLWEALEEGVIVPLGHVYKLADFAAQDLLEEISVEYKFAHDRLQHAAYALIPDVEKRTVHQQIGRCLLWKSTADDVEQKIFDIVDQLNLGRECIARQWEGDELAALNLRAGRKAKAAAAYEASYSYFQIGVVLLGENCWERQYDLALALYVEAAETAYLSSGLEQAEPLIAIVLRQAKTVIDKVKAYEVYLHAYAARHQPMVALSTGLQVLKLLGLSLPEEPSEADVERSLRETRLALMGKRLDELIDLPEMIDPDKLAMMRILASVLHCAFVGRPELHPLIVCGMVNLSVRYGNAPLSALAYATYGLILCG